MYNIMSVYKLHVYMCMCMYVRFKETLSFPLPLSLFSSFPLPPPPPPPSFPLPLFLHFHLSPHSLTLTVGYVFCLLCFSLPSPGRPPWLCPSQSYRNRNPRYKTTSQHNHEKQQTKQPSRIRCIYTCIKCVYTCIKRVYTYMYKTCIYMNVYVLYFVNFEKLNFRCFHRPVVFHKSTDIKICYDRTGHKTTKNLFKRNS